MTLVPSQFYDDSCAGEYLAQVVDKLSPEEVHSVYLKDWEAYCVFQGEEPVLCRMLQSLASFEEYNKISCCLENGRLSLAIAQGRSLLLANSYACSDFTSALYYILLAMKSLQLNPEVSTVCFSSPLEEEQSMLLYHYFKAVRQL
ncbi:MAG: DUF3822 family protein [Candidatus Cryptobacteroides sp.]